MSLRVILRSYVWQGILSLVLLIVLFINNGYADALYPLQTAKQESQFKHLLADLRCLVCQNQDLADSNAGLAKDLRAEVYNRVKDGQSDHEIITYLTDRYGDFILFNPPLKWITLFLWFAPLMFVGVGMIIFWRRFR